MRAVWPTASSSKVVLRWDGLLIFVALCPAFLRSTSPTTVPDWPLLQIVSGAALLPPTIGRRRLGRSAGAEHRLELAVERERLRVHGLLRPGDAQDQIERP